MGRASVPALLLLVGCGRGPCVAPLTDCSNCPRTREEAQERCDSFDGGASGDGFVDGPCGDGAWACHGYDNGGHSYYFQGETLVGHEVCSDVDEFCRDSGDDTGSACLLQGEIPPGC